MIPMLAAKTRRRKITSTRIRFILRDVQLSIQKRAAILTENGDAGAPGVRENKQFARFAAGRAHLCCGLPRIQGNV